MTSRAKLGKYPMISDIKKNLQSVQDKEDNSMVKILYKYQLSFTTEGLLRFDEDACLNISIY